MRNKWPRLSDWLLLLRLALAVALALPLTTTAAAPESPQADHFLYLPLILRPPTGITGLVTDGGVPAVGARLDLRRYNPVFDSWPLLSTVYTDAQGRYAFSNLTTLQAGQKYYILQTGNSTDPNHLLWWSPPMITAYTAGTQVELAPFDIAGVTSLAPDDNAHVTLPYTFQWTTRPATPQDNYRISFSGSVSFGSGPLGYVGAYNLQSLPPGAPHGPAGGYYWTVHIAWPDGSSGVQHIDRRVYFNNASLTRHLAPAIER
jgi:hypothetical protein